MEGYSRSLSQTPVAYVILHLACHSSRAMLPGHPWQKAFPPGHLSSHSFLQTLYQRAIDLEVFGHDSKQHCLQDPDHFSMTLLPPDVTAAIDILLSTILIIATLSIITS